jgi:hypothetical protein
MLTGFPYTDPLDFRLPEFTRTAWTSEAARETWAPRIAAIAVAWAETEWRSVAAGVRACALVRLPEALLLEAAARWHACGLDVEPLRLEAGARGAYQSVARPATGGAAPIICAGVGRRKDLRALRKAWDTADHDRLGALLGYPPCCRAFFEAVWVRDGCLDTTWAMALNTDATVADRTIEVSGPPSGNILWRWMGVRLVPHLPCAFDCEATEAFAEQLRHVGVEAGFGEAYAWMHEVLAWPVEWSALHGIAEIRTPILKVSTRSDATAGKYVVRRPGAQYPAEGGRGLSFPYQSPRRRQVADARAYRAGLSNPIETAAPLEDWRHLDNGFSSRISMDRLHAPIVALARRATEGLSGKVIDLGCGNGALLAKICEGRGDLIPFGVDRNPDAIRNAQSVHADRPGAFRRGEVFDAGGWGRERPFTLAILMLGRLLERPPEQAQALLSDLRNACNNVLLYVYPGWSKDSFASLLTQAGIRPAYIDDENRVALLSPP